MIYNKFINCSTLNIFNEKKEAGEITEQNIVFIQDVKQIWTGGVFYAVQLTVDDLEEMVTADLVKFRSDLVITAPIGVHTIGSSGSKTLPTNGKSVKQVFDMLVAEEKNPTITQPSVNLTSSSMGSKEVGTRLSPVYNATLNPGSYQYGPETGVTATSWIVTDSNGGNKSEASGTFNEFQVTDSTNYSITAKAEHTQGAIPVTNLGNEYEEGRIQASNGNPKVKTLGSITGYRNTFYGTTSDKSEITSEIIRGLSGKSNKNLSNGSKFTITVNSGAKRTIIAYPDTLRDLTEVLDVNASKANIVGNFKKSTVQVEGANGYEAKSYKVFTLEYGVDINSNTYEVTI